MPHRQKVPPATTMKKASNRNYCPQGGRDGFHSWIFAVRTKPPICCFPWSWMLQVGKQLFGGIFPLPVLFFWSLWLATSLLSGLLKSSMCLKDGPMFQDSKRGQIFQLPLGWFFFFWLFGVPSNKLTANPALWLWQKDVNPSPALRPSSHVSWTELVVAKHPATCPVCRTKSDWHLDVCKWIME